MEALGAYSLIWIDQDHTLIPHQNTSDWFQVKDGTSQLERNPDKSLQDLLNIPINQGVVELIKGAQQRDIPVAILTNNYQEFEQILFPRVEAEGVDTSKLVYCGLDQSSETFDDRNILNGNIYDPCVVDKTKLAQGWLNKHPLLQPFSLVSWDQFLLVDDRRLNCQRFRQLGAHFIRVDPSWLKATDQTSPSDYLDQIDHLVVPQ